MTPKDEQEDRALKRALTELRVEWGESFKPTLASLVSGWHKAVQEVENGYRLSIFDYAHDLQLRDVLEDIKQTVPERLRNEIDQAVKAWDERFLEATEPTDKPLSLASDEQPRAWWFRFPRKLNPDPDNPWFILSAK